MRIRGQNVNETFIKHALRPVFGAPTKSAYERACGDLHPDTGCRQLLDCLVLRTDPSEPLWMGQDRDIAGHQKIEEEVLKPSRRRMMRRLDQNIAGIGKCQELAGRKIIREILYHVNVGAGNQAQADLMSIQLVLQGLNSLADLRTRVLIKARQDVWRASDDRNAIGHKGARHVERDANIRGAIVNAR